jgi:hypothetical protein
MTELSWLSKVSFAATFALMLMPAKKAAAKVIPIKSAVKSFQLRKTCLIGYSNGV